MEMLHEGIAVVLSSQKLCELFVEVCFEPSFYAADFFHEHIIFPNESAGLYDGF